MIPQIISVGKTMKYVIKCRFGKFLIRAEKLLSRHKGVPGFPCRAILGVLEETLGFHKKNTRIEGFELLAEVGKACYEL